MEPFNRQGAKDAKPSLAVLPKVGSTAASPAH
jgi:hypothetical protein